MEQPQEQQQQQQQQGNPEQQPQQAFMMPDPSMGGAMPMSDAQFMMPFMLANGGAQASAQPNGGISAGKPTPSSPS